MAALHVARLRVPTKRRNQELLCLHRPTREHGDLRKLAERLAAKKLAENLAGGAIEHEAKAPVFRAVIGQMDDGAVEIRIEQTRMRDEQTARQAVGDSYGFAHGRVSSASDGKSRTLRGIVRGGRLVNIVRLTRQRRAHRLRHRGERVGFL